MIAALNTLIIGVVDINAIIATLPRDSVPDGLGIQLQLRNLTREAIVYHLK